MKVIGFTTVVAVGAIGFGIDTITGLAYWIPERNVRILCLKQPTGVAAANDANWQLVVGRQFTGQLFANTTLLPANDGGVKLGPNGITIAAGKVVQFQWTQAVAQVNVLTVFYEEF